jgi:hypothetical protein
LDTGIEDREENCILHAYFFVAGRKGIIAGTEASCLLLH